MGYPVAKITRLNMKRANPCCAVKAQPLAALDRLRYLLLLWPDLARPEVAGTLAPAAVSGEVASK